MLRDAGPFGASRIARAELFFAAGGGRTVLTRQSVPYPFHITRPFRLDRGRPELATLYLQSASGGLYRGDDLELALTVASGSAHVTTQAATVVHDTGTQPASQRATITVESDGFLAYTPDPMVLFPGASLRADTSVVLKPGAKAILTEGFTWHDPSGTNRPFDNLLQRLTISDANGRRLVKETAVVTGEDIVGPSSPVGSYRAIGTVLLLASPTLLPNLRNLVAACDGPGCLAGASELPNGAGYLLRCLALDGQTLRNALHAIFIEAFRSMVGVAPAPRRK